MYLMMGLILLASATVSTPAPSTFSQPKAENRSMPDLIHFVITGGTIDSVYDGIHDTVKPSQESVIPEYLEGLKSNQEFEFTTICMKDSRELNQADRQKTLEAIENSQA